jgi:hypothetical protein
LLEPNLTLLTLLGFANFAGLCHQPEPKPLHTPELTFQVKELSLLPWLHAPWETPSRVLAEALSSLLRQAPIGLKH